MRSAYSETSRESALEWYRGFITEHGRFPGGKDVEEFGGPGYWSRRALGNLPGIAEGLGVGRELLPRNTSYDDKTLIDGLSRWVLSQGIEKPPLARSLSSSRKNGADIPATEQVYTERFGSWPDALEKTGFFRFTWSPSECVGFSDVARRNSTTADLRAAIREQAVRGVTPTLTDVLSHYPNLRGFSANRLSWNVWPERMPTNSEQNKKRRALSVSFGVLALVFADGNMGDIEHAARALHREHRGPEPANIRPLFANLAPKNMTDDAARYVWGQDLVERVYFVAVRGEKDSSIPLNKAGIDLPAKEVVSPYFWPEINELLAA